MRCGCSVACSRCRQVKNWEDLRFLLPLVPMCGGMGRWRNVLQARGCEGRIPMVRRGWS